MNQPSCQSFNPVNPDLGNTEKLPALRFRCERCAAAVMKHSKYSVFSLYRKETKYATVRNEKLSEFSALLALSAVNKYLFDHRFAEIMTDLHRLEAEYSIKRFE